MSKLDYILHEGKKTRKKVEPKFEMRLQVINGQEVMVKVYVDKCVIPTQTVRCKGRQTNDMSLVMKEGFK